jgi:hypothetical protein
MKYILSLSFVFLIAYTNLLFPVTMPDSNTIAGKVDIAGVSATKLQQKLLLSDEGTLKVKEILNNYLNNHAANDNNAALVQDKISSLLDQKQKAKFEIVKNEWWNSFTKGMKKVKAK